MIHPIHPIKSKLLREMPITVRSCGFLQYAYATVKHDLETLPTLWLESVFMEKDWKAVNWC